jgi:F0F1-type ATP synthase assembly protein I
MGRDQFTQAARLALVTDCTLHIDFVLGGMSYAIPQVILLLKLRKSPNLAFLRGARVRGA